MANKTGTVYQTCRKGVPVLLLAAEGSRGQSGDTQLELEHSSDGCEKARVAY